MIGVINKKRRSLTAQYVLSSSIKNSAPDETDMPVMIVEVEQSKHYRRST